MLRKQKEQHSEFKKYVKQRMRKGNPIKAEKLQDMFKYEPQVIEKQQQNIFY